MNDLISRRAAIKAIDDLPNCYNGYSDTYDKAYIIGVLEELPTADVPDRKVGKWIPVSERLPGYGEQVVANFRNEQISRNRIGVSYCYVQKEGFFSDVPFEYKVVAWMPLPDPWKEEEG